MVFWIMLHLCREITFFTHINFLFKNVNFWFSIDIYNLTKKLVIYDKNVFFTPSNFLLSRRNLWFPLRNRQFNQEICFLLNFIMQKLIILAHIMEFFWMYQLKGTFFAAGSFLRFWSVKKAFFFAAGSFFTFWRVKKALLLHFGWLAWLGQPNHIVNCI